MKLAITVAAAVLVGIALICLLTAYITYRMAFHVTNKKRKTDPFYDLHGEMTPRKEESKKYIEDLLALPYEEVSIKSFDGLTLYARYYHVKDGAPTEIQCHGYRSVSTHDFSAGGLECMKMGYNLLLIDQRAHGKSEGRVISFGIKERYDVLSWVNYLNDRFGKKSEILLYGISMGAGTVLMASSLPMPENVVGVVADCSYSTVKDIIMKVVYDMHFPAKFFYPFIRLGARLFGGFDPDEISPISEVKNNKIPILLIHGEGDNFVPCDMSREIYKSASDAVLVTVAEAGHGLSFIYDREKYMAAVNEFHARVLTRV